MTRLLVAILIIAILALAIALEATGHFVFRGRLILLSGVRQTVVGSLAMAVYVNKLRDRAPLLFHRRCQP